MSDLQMDNADTAARDEEQVRTLALKNFPGAVHGQSATFCRECEEPIPEKRRKAVPGCQLCVECQQEQERRL